MFPKMCNIVVAESDDASAKIPGWLNVTLKSLQVQIRPVIKSNFKTVTSAAGGCLLPCYKYFNILGKSWDTQLVKFSHINSYYMHLFERNKFRHTYLCDYQHISIKLTSYY